MSESQSLTSLPQSASGAALNPMVERILDQRFPLKVIYDALDSLPQTRDLSANDATTSFYALVQADRERLLLLADSDLRALAAQLDAQRVANETARIADQRQKEVAKAAKKEASKFYNQKTAEADFSFWSKLDFWTFDESIALVLGKEPKAVTWPAIQGELDPRRFFISTQAEPSGFVRQYVRIREIALRAEAMSGDRLRPVQFLLWAAQNEIVEPPAELVSLVTKRLMRQHESAVSASAATTDKTPITPPTSSNADLSKQPIKWTPDRLAELSKFKRENGTKAAAAHFKISTSRVRKLLPTEPEAAPEAAGAFNWLHK